MVNRFSKKSLAHDLQTRINAVQDVWGFDPSNGTHQIKYVAAAVLQSSPIPGIEATLEAHVTAAAVAYGEWSVLVQLAEDLDLDVYAVHGRLYPTNIPGAPSNLIRYRRRRSTV
jgi:hypothetical protein